MGRRINKMIAFSACVTTGIYFMNRMNNYNATSKNLLTTKGGTFYNWKNGDIFYTVEGSGSPVLLIHDLEPSSSSAEWTKIIKRLGKKHTVYRLDLLGCGRSNKPYMTYTNYLFVQLINDFVKDVIQEKTTLVATGNSASFSIMTNIMNPENFTKIIAINPGKPEDALPKPDKKQILYKYLLDCPIFGTLLYNVEMSQKSICKKIQNNWYSESKVAPTTLLNTYFEAAHLGKEKGRHLLSSIRAGYTDISVSHAIPKIDNLSIIGSRERKNNQALIDAYTKRNPDIEAISISGSKYLPQLEVPEKFCEVLNMLIDK